MEVEPNRQSLTKLRFALQQFGSIDMKMQLQTALVLLFVAEYQDRPEGITTADLQRQFGMSNAAASRNTHYWFRGEASMNPNGAGLLVVADDLSDRRKRTIRLSPEGEAFVRKLTSLLSD